MAYIPMSSWKTPEIPLWLDGVVGTPANILASTVTVNAVPNGNITLTHTLSSSTEFNAPIIFQRPPADINAPSESLVMNTSLTVPTKPTNGQYITATKAAGTAYDDIAVQGLQVYGNQTTAGNSGAAAYITGSNGSLILAAQNSVYVSSLIVSSFTATNVISNATAPSFTASVFMSTPILNTNYISSVGISTGVLLAGQLEINKDIFTPSISTNTISTSQIVSKDVFTSTLTVSTLNAPNFVISTINTSTINSVFTDTKFSLTSTLSLLGNVDVNLGLGNQIAGLIGGAGAQALGVSLGGAGLITGAAALVSGRTSGGVNNSIFQTVNGSTQLQFSTIGSNVSSIFLTTNSASPFTTPGLEIQQSQGVAAGTYCVRSVGDPLYINNNVSSIQMFGQWVPVIQPTATIPALAISSLGVSTSQSVTGNVSSLFVSSVNGAVYPPPSGAPTIPSTIALSTATFLGNLSSIGAGSFVWGGNTITPTQVTLTRPTAINNTLTTTGAAFLNAGATTNSLTISALGSLTAPGGGIFSWGALPDFRIQGGVVTVNALAQFNQGAIMSQNLSASGGLTVTGGTVQFNPSVTMLGNLSVVGTGRFSSVSTNTISTNSIISPFGSISSFVVSSINGLPPGGGSSGGIPSTLNASTITFDGGLTNIGSEPITTNTINTTNANVNFYVGNAINAGSISTTTISTNTVFAANITTNTMNTTTTNANNIQAAAISTNTLSTNIVRAAAISSFSISTNILNVNTINGQPYTPGGGGGGITSTLNASTINVNGGINIANGGIINTSFEPIRTGFLSTNFISTSLLTTDALKADFLSTVMIRAAGVSTNFISCQTIRAESISSIYLSTLTTTASNIGCFQFSSLTGSINSLTTTTLTTNTFNTFSISTINLSTTVTTAVAISTNTISTNNIGSLTGNVSSLSVSSINGLTIPGTLGLPVGSITIWAGGSDNNTSVQNLSVPAGWLACDGSFFLNSLYPVLADVLGQKYGYPGQSPPGGYTALPDLTFAVPMGVPYRNYNNTIISTIPSLTLSAVTWDSQYSSTISSVTTWKFTNKIGPAINYGTLFPGSFVSTSAGTVSFPNMYVSTIIKYDGGVLDQGYIVLRSIDGASPIPRVPNTSTINATAQGTAGVTDGADTPYFIGSPNVQNKAVTTRNQKGAEVGPHTHTYNRYGIFGSSGLANGNIDPSKASSFIETDLTTQLTVSTLNNQNIGTYMAPNFLNMVYIIKA